MAEPLPQAVAAFDRCAVALKLLRELHAMVWGETPSLLNEDSGGNAQLDIEIRAVLDAPDNRDVDTEKVVVYKCPQCNTGLEVDPFAKPHSAAIHTLAQEDFDNLVRDAMSWRKKDITEYLQTAAVQAWIGRNPKEAIADVKMVLRGFDEGIFVRNIERDHESDWAIKAWPFLAAIGRLAASRKEAQGSDGPTATDCNKILGKPGHYKDGPKDP